MSTDMLSPFESASVGAAALIIVAGAGACYAIGGTAGIVLGIVLLALLPATDRRARFRRAVLPGGESR